MHENAAARHARAKKTEVDIVKVEAKRKVSAGLGGFKMQGSANALPPDTGN